MKKIATFFLSMAVVGAQAHPVDPRPGQPLVQLALLLDTSNSMDGLIDQAKSQLWRVVNDLASSRRDGRAPQIEVALYEYGNSNLAAGENYLRQVLSFTNDLDQVSEKLFALRTRGGEEHCGAVIGEAVRGLSWDPAPRTYRTIFIAGNEPFNQGKISFKDAVQRAVDKDIRVNTIFCGDRREGTETYWKEGAVRGRGDFLAISQDEEVRVRRSPYDDEIERLGRMLNDTYIYYGPQGRKAALRQSMADESAAAMAPSGASVERSLFKSKPQYNAARAEVDAVESVASDRIKPSELKTEALPPAWRNKTPAELETAFKEKNTERKKIQRQLEELGKKRGKFLAEQPTATQSLDRAIREAVRAQAQQLGFSFE